MFCSFNNMTSITKSQTWLSNWTELPLLNVNKHRASPLIKHLERILQWFYLIIQPFPYWQMCIFPPNRSMFQTWMIPLSFRSLLQPTVSVKLGTHFPQSLLQQLRATAFLWLLVSASMCSILLQDAGRVLLCFLTSQLRGQLLPEVFLELLI